MCLPARAGDVADVAAHDKQGPGVAGPGRGPCTASVGGCGSSQAPSKHHVCLELKHLCCPLILVPGFCCGLWTQNPEALLYTDEFEVLFKNTIFTVEHHYDKVSDTCSKFCFSLSLFTRSVYTKRLHSRHFQYWACAFPSL